MHKRRTRRQQIAIRSFTYGAMALLATFGIVICLAWSMGFRIDWNSRQLTQVALLQFNTFPTGATVDINGQELSAKTQTRSNVKTGETTVVMSKQGYRSWSKTVNMLPSSVVWLNYARLIPNSIVTDATNSFAGLVEMRESPDKKWLLLRHSDNSRYKDGVIYDDMTHEAYLSMPFTLTLVDISDPKNVRFSDLTIPSDKITRPTDGQDEKFEIVEWDQGSRFILIKHTVGEMVEYLELDRANSGIVKNLTRDFGMPISSPHFAGTSGNIFFALTGTDLRKFDYGNNTASTPLAKNVQSYKSYENSRLVFVSAEAKGNNTTQSVGFYNDGRVTIVKTFLDAKPTMAVLARFNNDNYLAIARGDNVTVYPRPLDQNDKSQLIYISSLGGIDWLDVSPNGQFILAGHGDNLVSLDLDTSTSYSFEVKNTKGAPDWIDGSHIVGTNNDQITFIEFDGQNRENIVGARGRVTLSRDGKYFFSVGDAAGGAVLQRSKLVID